MQLVTLGITQEEQGMHDLRTYLRRRPPCLRSMPAAKIPKLFIAKLNNQAQGRMERRGHTCNSHSKSNCY